MRKPLPKGTAIHYKDVPAIVIKDTGSYCLRVECDGTEQVWDWEFEDIKCTVDDDEEDTYIHHCGEKYFTFKNNKVYCNTCREYIEETK